MKVKFISLFLLSAVLMATSCTGRKKLEKGNYDEAVLKSIKRLRSNPDNNRAQDILEASYSYSKSDHLRQVNQILASQKQFRWDDVVWHYERLNYLNTEINKCPACLEVVPDPVYFTSELDSARYRASREHFEYGQVLMQRKDVLTSREAFRHFVKARDYTPQYNKINDWVAAALDAGTINVVIEEIPIHSRSLQLSNEFFQNQVRQYAQGLNYTFVQFFSPIEAESSNLRVDQVIVFRFDDFIVGQTYLKEVVEKIQKDSVKVGDIKMEDGTSMPVYGTVQAELHRFSKSVTSTGLLDFKIVDAVSGATMLQNKFPGTYVWNTEWGFYNGDKDALEDSHLDLVRRKEAFPPAPQELFIAFTQPIFNQMTGQIQSFYRSHN